MGTLSNVLERVDCPSCRLAAQVSESLMPTPNIIITKVEAWLYSIAFRIREEGRISTHYGTTICFWFKNDQGISVSSGHLYPLNVHTPKLENSQFTTRQLSGAVEKAHLIRRWIDQCDQTHGDTCAPCKATAVWLLPGFLVIDVLNDCLTTLPVQERYFALSYVWGRIEYEGARKKNIDCLKEPGGLKDPSVPIPKTIRDAIWLTRTIGERYLWVDLFCIVQDDNTTKHTMISCMDKIYLHAAATIFAVTGKDADSGLFASSAEGTGQGEVSSEGLTLSTVKSYTFPSDTTDNPNWFIYKRTWTLQEQLLSKRQIYFVHGMAFFVCPASHWREDLVAEAVIQGPGTYDHHNTLEVFPRILYENDLERPLGFAAFSRFKSCVIQYMGRELSYSSDRMNAFAGIGSFLGQQLGTPLLFGLPVKYFTWALLWAFRDINNIERRSDFPSWSWVGWKCSPDWYQIQGTMGYGTQNQQAIAQMTCDTRCSRSITWQYWSARTRRFEQVQSDTGKPDRSTVTVGAEASNSPSLERDTDGDAIQRTTLTYPAAGPAGHLKFIAEVLTLEIAQDGQKLRIHDGLSNYVGDVCRNLQTDSITPPFIGCHDIILLSNRAWEQQKTRYKRDISKYVEELEQEREELYSVGRDYLTDEMTLHISKKCEHHPWTWSLYNVLIIEWKEGIAYRLATGWIYREAREHSFEPGCRRMEIILG